MGKSKLFKLIRLWLPPILWAGVIFAFSALPTRKTSEFFLTDFIIKKTAHVIEYAIFAALLYRAFKESGVRRRNAGLYAILLAVIYAGTDEFHQSFTPGREPTLRDIFFDTIGSILAIYAIWNLLPKAPKRLKSWAENWRLI
ncbi:VanZ family protein [Candidatus Woesebacteria bacterium]|nr:VanZ family protein [Candidatus Woesebacteria bacterium]